MSDDDPFEELGADEDREGDPFEELGDDGAADTGSGDNADPAQESTDDGEDPEFVEEFIEAEPEFGANPAADPESAADDAPEFEAADDAPEFEAADDELPAFGTGSADDDSVFEGADEESGFESEFFEEGPSGTEGAPLSSGDADPFDGMVGREDDPFGDGESVFEAVEIEELSDEEVWASLDEDREPPSVGSNRYTDVSKHRFCEQCEHFSEPPAAHCTHEEAEIIEYLDMETVRLLDCPVVAEQRELHDDQ